MRLAMQTGQWAIKWLVTFALTLLFALGLLAIAQGLFQVFLYYYFSKGPRSYPVSTDSLFSGLKLLALYVVVIWLLMQYRFNQINQVIVKRSAILGAVLGVLLIGVVALDRFVVYYYTQEIDCNLPGPTQKPYCKPR